MGMMMRGSKAQTRPRRDDNDSHPNTGQGRHHHPQSVPNNKLKVQIVRLLKLRPRHQDNRQINGKRHSPGEGVDDGYHQRKDGERMRGDEPRSDEVEEGDARDDGVKRKNDEERAAHSG